MKHNYKFDGKKDGIFYWHCSECFKVRTTIEFDDSECEEAPKIKSEE